MASRVGITGNLEKSKIDLEGQYKNTRSWRSTPSFKTKKEAQAWEATKMSELKCKTVKAGSPPKNQHTGWFGFFFEHDGPR